MTLMQAKYHNKTNHFVGCYLAFIIIKELACPSVCPFVADITHQNVKLGISKRNNCQSSRDRNERNQNTLAQVISTPFPMLFSGVTGWPKWLDIQASLTKAIVWLKLHDIPWGYGWLTGETCLGERALGTQFIVQQTWDTSSWPKMYGSSGGLKQKTFNSNSCLNSQGSLLVKILR